MSNLSPSEKRKFERLFNMDNGYVLSFTNGSFQNLVIDAVEIDIYDKKYGNGGGSKANRLRAFWREESNSLVSKLLEELLKFWRSERTDSLQEATLDEKKLYEDCLKILERLKNEMLVENVDVLVPNSEEVDFGKLSKSIRETIERNEPEQALDRLHTFVVKYLRNLCSKYSIHYDKNVPLHSLFGGYIKHLQEKNLIESDMTIRILKSSISILEAFNEVRNNKTFAHSGKLLNYHESLLIFNNVSNTILFIKSIEERGNLPSADATDITSIYS